MEHIIRTDREDQLIDITAIIREDVRRSNIKNGTAVVFVPHTTAGITINENADPDVVIDFLEILRKLVPKSRDYRHLVKASLVGSSCTLIIEDGRLKLGTWQGVYFCEFDGPRTRKFYTKIIGS